MLLSKGVCNMAMYGDPAFPILSLISLKTDLGSRSSATTSFADHTVTIDAR